MHSDYGEKTYLILSKIVKLNFKSQLKDSGLEFKDIFKVVSLKSDFKYYSLITNEDPINFVDQIDFIEEFISFLEKNIAYLDSQTDTLGRTENERFVENDYLGHYSYKQSKILKKMIQFQNKIKTSNS